MKYLSIQFSRPSESFCIKRRVIFVTVWLNLKLTKFNFTHSFLRYKKKTKKLQIYKSSTKDHWGDDIKWPNKWMHENWICVTMYGAFNCFQLLFQPLNLCHLTYYTYDHYSCTVMSLNTHYNINNAKMILECVKCCQLIVALLINAIQCS